MSTTNTNGRTVARRVASPVTPTDIQAIGRRLIQRSERIERDLSERLETVRQVHDLDWQALLTLQKAMEHLGQRELAPSASEFWTATASPATAPLVEQACAAIDAGLAEYGLALKKFEDSLRHAFRRPLNVDDVERAMLIEALDAASEEARERMERCYPDRSPLDKLGARWQGKLRRAARRSQLRTTLMSTVAQAEMAAQVAEMKLLDEPPWLHGDRLLTAFELAHADIRTHLLDGLDRISVVVPRLALSE